MKAFVEWMQSGALPKQAVYLCFFGLLVRLMLAWLPEKHLFYLVSDDAYYYFSVARNLATRGMLSADGITLTNGFHPLWLFIITPIFALFKANQWLCIHFVLAFSAVFDTAAGFLIYKTLKQLGKEKAGFWAAAFYLVNPFSLLHTMNGLETALNNFFLALLIYLSAKAHQEWFKNEWLFLGTACGLALLSRTDNIFAVAVLFAYLFWRHRNISAGFKAGGTAALLVGPWLAYNYLAFGSPVQTSGTAYPWLYHQQYLNQYGTYFSFHLIPHLFKMAYHNLLVEGSFHYGSWVLTVLLGSLVVFRLKNSWANYGPVVWPLCASALFLFFHVFVRWSVRPWYPQAAFVLTLPLAALSLPSVRRWALWSGGMVCLLLSGWEVWTTPFRLADRSLVMQDLIDQKIPLGDRVGAFNSGFLQYFAHRRVINLDGLVNNEVLSYYKEKRGLDYFRKRNIRWLLDTPVYLCVVFGPYFGAGAESSLTVVDAVENIAYPGNSIMVVGVLPESLVAQPDREMPIWRGPPVEGQGDTLVFEK